MCLSLALYERRGEIKLDLLYKIGNGYDILLLKQTLYMW